jgi:PAS domain S-box-containing protein
MTSLASLIGFASEAVVGFLEDPVQTNDDLRSRERFYRELLDALPAAIYTTDPAGRVTFFNQAAVALTGRTPELGSDRWCVSWRLFWPDGTPLAHDECPMAIALREGQAIRGTELIAERPDGVRIPILPYPTPLHDAAGNLVGAVNMLVDVSDRKKAEQALHRLNAMLKQNVEERTQEGEGSIRQASRQ